MEYDQRRVVERKVPKEPTGITRRGPDVNNGRIEAPRDTNDQFFHITVPPSMKEEIAKQKSHLEDQGMQQRLQELTFASPMDHLKEENKRLLSELQQVKQGDGRIAAKLLTNMEEMRHMRSKLRDSEKKVRQLEAERSRMQNSIGSGARSDHEIERLRDDVQRWKSEAEKWKSDAAQLQMQRSQGRPRGAHSAGNAINQAQGPDDRASETRLNLLHVKQLEQELEETKKVNVELSGVNKDWESQYNQMKRDYERQVTQLTESLKDMQNQMMKALDNADEEKRHHEEQVRKLQDQIAATRQRADQAENRNHGTASDYDQLSKEYKTIERKWREASTQLADERRQTENLRHEIALLQNRLSQQQSLRPDDVERLKEQNQYFRDQLEHDRQNRDRFEREVAQLRETIRVTEANRGGYQQQNDEIEALRTQVALYKDDYDREKREKDRLQRELQASRPQQSNRSGLQHQGDEMEALREQTRIFQADFEREKDDKQRLQTQLSEKHRTLRSLETTNAALQEQVSQCRIDFERERQDKEDYLRQLRRERTGSVGQHQLSGSRQALSTVDQFGDQMVQEQREVWERLEQQRRSQGGIPQAANPRAQPNIIDGAPS